MAMYEDFSIERPSRQMRLPLFSLGCEIAESLQWIAPASYPCASEVGLSASSVQVSEIPVF